MLQLGLGFDSAGNLRIADGNNDRVLDFGVAGTSTSTSTTTTTTATSSSSTAAATPMVSPGTAGGAQVPLGATFKDTGGHTWLATGGNQGGVMWSSFSFPGSQNAYPVPMQQGWGGDHGTYNGQQGWIIAFYC